MGTPVSSTNKTDRHDITETCLIVVLNKITSNHYFSLYKPNTCLFQTCKLVPRRFGLDSFSLYNQICI
jgi:hypothetical protein